MAQRLSRAFLASVVLLLAAPPSRTPGRTRSRTSPSKKHCRAIRFSRASWRRGERIKFEWERILDGLERRYWRRDGVEEPDIEQVKTILAEVIRKEQAQG